MVMLGGAGGAYRDFFHPENDDALSVRALCDQTAELGAMLYSSMLRRCGVRSPMLIAEARYRSRSVRRKVADLQ
ncbi:hypothetical protein EMIHUDRAFT_360440 [Emiliania huxleyi CCMP1516]|uniref:Uncharacterized protein n=4 Tax=Emiliania huxleyi TaxID=2903 RepID=A0A0D3HYH4_EMIH1|nr:hypothetical protein EMIHUDRAFT_360440 [Emiliania huxleyi CCMP1516]EOD04059.1 hypothetical protein EMIHUDRAFT_360440 [Emiliania huxleyi CCMP1516]|eukprot:XP_005756488.1 hypothetical protein EMIHUDRAFT_360440 [Emiliania huxleyi CCMP1516]